MRNFSLFRSIPTLGRLQAWQSMQFHTCKPTPQTWSHFQFLRRPTNSALQTSSKLSSTIRINKTSNKRQTNFSRVSTPNIRLEPLKRCPPVQDTSPNYWTLSQNPDVSKNQVFYSTCSKPPKIPDCPPKKSDCAPKKSDCAPKKTDCAPKKTDCAPKKPDCAQKKTDCAPKKPDCAPRKTDCAPKKPDCAPKQPDCAPKKPDCAPKSSACTPKPPEKIDCTPKPTKCPEKPACEPKSYEKACPSNKDTSSCSTNKAKCPETKCQDPPKPKACTPPEKTVCSKPPSKPSGCGGGRNNPPSCGSRSFSSCKVAETLAMISDENSGDKQRQKIQEICSKRKGKSNNSKPIADENTMKDESFKDRMKREKEEMLECLKEKTDFSGISYMQIYCSDCVRDIISRDAKQFFRKSNPYERIFHQNTEDVAAKNEEIISKNENNWIIPLLIR